VKIGRAPLGGQFQDLHFLRRAFDIDVLVYAGTEEILPERIAELIVERGLSPRLGPDFPR